MTTSRPCSDSPLSPLARRKALAITTLALALASAVPSFADTTSRDAAICASLTADARAALASGYADAATTLLDEALTFAPSDPDANYLRAMLGLSGGDSLASAAALLERALTGSGFRLYRAEDARLLYAAVLARTRRPEAALRFVSGVPPSAESLYVESIARLAVGDDPGSRAAALSSLRRYPADPRPLIAWLRARKRELSSPGDAELVSAGFAALDSIKEMDPAALVALAPYAASADESRLLVREYRAIGRSSADATVLALRYGLVGEDRAVAEMLSGRYVPTEESIRALYASLSSDESRTRFVRAFSSFSGEISRDVDRDGVPESTTLYASGSPSAWALDENQDGEPEMEASFSSGAPRTLRAVSGSVSVTMRYGSWPFVDTTAYVDADGSRTYSLGPAVMPGPVVSLETMTGLPGGPYLVYRNDRPLPTETLSAGLAYASRRTGSGEETAELFEGEPTRIWWRDARRRIGYAVYRGGMPIDETIDADGDGRYESRRIWRRGEDGIPAPAYYETDLDGDGLFEYREGLGVPRLQSWDYDGDGTADMSLETRPDGTVAYRYASPDGSVTEAVYRNGRIEGVMEDGRTAPLVPDSGGLVVWIGKKPFDFGPVAPPAGKGSRNGVLYVVFSIAGASYAQVTD